MVALVLSGVIGWLAYLLLAGSMSASELVTGTVLGLAVSAWTALRRRRSPMSFAFSSTHWRVWGRAVRQLPRQTGVAGRFLLRATIRPVAAQGKTAVRPFHHGAIDDPAERARRATVVLTASLAPASYIVRVAPGHDDVLVHTADAALNGDSEWLV